MTDSSVVTVFKPDGTFLRVERDNGLVLHNAQPADFAVPVSAGVFVDFPGAKVDLRNGDQVEFYVNNPAGAGSGDFRILGSPDDVNYEILVTTVLLIVGAESFQRLTRDQTVPRFIKLAVRRTLDVTAVTLRARLAAKGPG